MIDKIQMKIGVDCDGVSVNCIDPLLAWYNHKHGTNFNSNQMVSQDLSRLWGGSEEDVIKECMSFYRSKYFKQIKPVPGAQEGIERLSKKNELFLITARPISIEKRTKDCIEKYFPKKFIEIILSDEFSLNKKNISKMDIYFESQIKLVIEDSLLNAIDCAVNNIDVILLDYSWNRSQKLHQRINRVKDWKELQKDYSYLF